MKENSKEIRLSTVLTQELGTLFTHQYLVFHVFVIVHSVLESEFSAVYHIGAQRCILKEL